MAKLFSRRPTSAEDKLKQMEELLKLRKGTGLSFAQETGATPGYILPMGRTLKSQELASAVPSQQQLTQYAPNTEPYTPEPTPETNPEGEQQPGNISVEDFVNQLSDLVYNPPQEAEGDYLEALYQATGIDYGVASMSDGSIKMRSGRIADPTTEVFPVASHQNGGVIMSNGQVYSVDPSLAQYIGQSGTAGLSQFLFGKQQKVTQPYGAYNPIEPTPGNINLGTDFRTRDFSGRVTIPVQAKVLQVLQDDGTRYGDISGHQGYGNSILLQLPDGKQVRLSHLAELPNVRVGQDFAPGQLKLTPGTTGNVTGEHLDVELKDAQGKIISPEQFTIDKNLLGNMGKASSEYVPGADQANFRPQQNQPMQQMQQQMQPEPPRGIISTAQEGIQAAQNVQRAAQPRSPERMAAGQAVGQLGQKAGIPELYASETVSGQVTPGQAISKNLENIPQTGIDLGLSELARGDVGGARKNFESTMARISSRLGRVPGQLQKEIIPQAYAEDGTPRQESLRQNIGDAANSIGEYANRKVGDITSTISQTGQEFVGKAGQGLERLKSFFGSGSNSNLQARPSISSMTERKAVGSVGSGVGVTPQQANVNKTNDISDPFFRFGLDKQYGDQVNPQARASGVFDINTFNESFYQNPENLSVFTGTPFQGQAEQKYANYVAAEEARKAEEAQKSYQNQLREQLRSRGLDAGQIENFIKEGRVFDPESGNSSAPGGVWNAPTTSQLQSSQRTGGSGSSSVTLPSGRVVTAAPGTKIYTDSSGNVQQVRDTTTPLPGGGSINFDTPTKTPSAQLTSQAQNSGSNIFQRMLSKLFRR